MKPIQFRGKETMSYNKTALPPAEGADTITGNSFHLTWKDARKELPKEVGRYWCVVREVNDLGISYYQWNCAYNPNDTSLWTDRLVSQDVIWWTELAPMPNLQMQQQLTAEGAEEILKRHCKENKIILTSNDFHTWLNAINEIAALHAQRLAEEMLKAVFNEIWDAPVPDDVFENPDYRMSFADAKIVAEKFATIHAQRLVEKKIRGELMRFRNFFNELDPKDYILERDVNEYLKSRE